MIDHMIPADLVSSGAECIAFASTESSGFIASRIGRDRWTELSVYYLHTPGLGGKRWVAQTLGKTRVEGEQTRRTRMVSGTLERALKLIDQSGDIGIVVAETAREWAEDNRVTVENGRGGALAFDTDRAALAWLYGEPETHNGFPTMLAHDVGASSSTVRMALASGNPVRVPLRALLPFIDRAAFRRARETARG